MDDDLEARLESHAQAFEGLLSLSSAQDYYGRDNSDQWQRKKQTKAEKKAARLAKLDPANRKSAMDVIRENEKKRKRELGIESDHEKTLEDNVDAVQRPAKKSKKDSKEAEEPHVARTKADKRRDKRERQKEKVNKIKQKVEAKKTRKEERQEEQQVGDDEVVEIDDEMDSTQDLDKTLDVDALDVSGLVDDEGDSVVSNGAENDSTIHDQSSTQSAASSATSIDLIDAIAPIAKPMVGQEPVAQDESKSSRVNPTKKLNIPKIDSEELQARLKLRIEQLRARRKADGPDGQPARSRQELLDSRRKKSEARKAHKKQLRAQAKAETERLEQQRLQGSGSPLSADIFSPVVTPASENNFSFGRVAFEGGGVADPTLQQIKDDKHKKAVKDPKQALEMAKKKEQRLGAYDESKRKDIEEKDRWLAMKKKAHGERVRDDTNLLKKALKRKEKSKSKSEKEWKDREDGVKKGQVMKQKKREVNLAKRRDDKGKKGTGKKAKPVKKKKGRAGFEGK